MPVEPQPIRAPRRRFATLMATLCVALVFIASLVEVSHYCESDPGSAKRQTTSQTSHRRGSGICEICATSHQVSSPTVTSPAVLFFVSVSVPLVPVQPLSRLQQFTMDVRPPPPVSL